MTPFYALLITKLSNARLKGRIQSCGRQIHLCVTFTCLALVLIRSVLNRRRHLLGSLCGPTLRKYFEGITIYRASFIYVQNKFRDKSVRMTFSVFHKVNGTFKQPITY